MPARAQEAASRAETARATGILDEIVFVDRARPFGRVPAASYVALARLLLANGDRARAGETLRALAARGGGVPADLRELAGG